MVSSRSWRFARELAVVFALLVFGGSASASHYYLEDVDFLEMQELDAFQGFGIQTTEELLRAIHTPTARHQLASSTGLAAQRLEELARTCDLLQVIGIGPRAARLVLAAGVADAQDLAQRDPAELVAALADANATGRFTETNPGIEHVRDWVASAAQRTIQTTW